jgi:hypothetical protein
MALDRSVEFVLVMKRQTDECPTPAAGIGIGIGIGIVMLISSSIRQLILRRK